MLMTHVERITVPHLMLELDTDVDIINHIGDELGRLSLDKRALVYCGIEGEGTNNGLELPQRDSTFASTYDDLLEQAKMYDRYRNADNYYPFTYVRSTELPALLAYDQDCLISAEYQSPALWLPKPGTSLSDAARAFIQFC